MTDDLRARAFAAAAALTEEGAQHWRDVHPGRGQLEVREPELLADVLWDETCRIASRTDAQVDLETEERAVAHYRVRRQHAADRPTVDDRSAPAWVRAVHGLSSAQLERLLRTLGRWGRSRGAAGSEVAYTDTRLGLGLLAAVLAGLSVDLRTSAASHPLDLSLLLRQAPPIEGELVADTAVAVLCECLADLYDGDQHDHRER